MVAGFSCSPGYSGIFFFQILLLGPTVALLTNSLLCEWQPTAASGMNFRPFQPVLPPQGRPKTLLVPQSLAAANPSWGCTCWGTTRLCQGTMGLGRLWASGLGCPGKGIPAWVVCLLLPHSQPCLSALLERAVQQLCLTNSASQGRSFQIKSFNSSLMVLQEEPFAGGTAASKYPWFHRYRLAKTSEFHSMPGVLLRSCHQSLGSEGGQQAAFHYMFVFQMRLSFLLLQLYSINVF